MWNGQMKSLHDIMDHINYGSEQFEDISSRQGRGGPRCLCFGNGRAGGAYAILYLFSQCPPPIFPDVTDRLQESIAALKFQINFGFLPFATEVAHSLLFNSGLAG